MISKRVLQVRTYECDSYGHVNNANYLNYLEFARYEFLKDIAFDYPAVIRAGYGVYVARVEIDYRRPARVDDFLEIHTWSVKKGAVSGVLGQEIYLADSQTAGPQTADGNAPQADALSGDVGRVIIASAKVTWAFVNASGALTRIPPEWDMPGLRPENQTCSIAIKRLQWRNESDSIKYIAADATESPIGLQPTDTIGSSIVVLHQNT